MVVGDVGKNIDERENGPWKWSVRFCRAKGSTEGGQPAWQLLTIGQVIRWATAYYTGRQATLRIKGEQAFGYVAACAEDFLVHMDMHVRCRHGAKSYATDAPPSRLMHGRSRMNSYIINCYGIQSMATTEFFSRPSSRWR